MQSNRDNQQATDANSVIELAVATTIGHREEQQDGFGYELMPSEGLVVICDGMGGHEGGKIASSLAVNEFLEAYRKHYPCDDAVSFLQEATHKASKKISDCKSGNGGNLNAGSTLVAVMIQNKQLFWSSVGDSRAYLLRNGEYAQITQDHNYKTVLEEQLRAGVIDAAQFESQSGKAEALISYLGIPELILIDYNSEALLLQKGDKIILMTDGLYKIVKENEIFQVIDNFSNIAEALQALEAKAKKYSRTIQNRDNMTVAIIQVK